MGTSKEQKWGRGNGCEWEILGMDERRENESKDEMNGEK